MEQEYIYGVARIRALEGSLLQMKTLISWCSARIMTRLWIS